MRYLPALALAALLAPITAQAANPPSATLVGTMTTGVISQSGVYSCSSGSTFQDKYPLPFGSSYLRPTATGPIILNLGPLRYQGGRTVNLAFIYGGVAALHFTTATSGRIQWDLAPVGNGNTAVGKVRKFSGYTETYDPTQHMLKLSFSIDFGGCSLPAIGVFHG